MDVLSLTIYFLNALAALFIIYTIFIEIMMEMRLPARASSTSAKGKRLQNLKTKRTTGRRHSAA